MKHRSRTLRIIILSGPICSGKSELALRFRSRYSARIIKTRDLIKQKRPRVKDERGALQRAGEALDRKDGGTWVRDALARLIDKMEGNSSNSLVVIDSVRIPGQVQAIREAFGRNVHHIHLYASEKVLAKRYRLRPAKTKEFDEYHKVRSSRTEHRINELANLADIVVSTDLCEADGVLVRATAVLDLYPRTSEPLVDVVVGGQYGSEGKGNIVGHIAAEYDLLVRVGGPNAGHQVFGDPPEVYHHLPSGSGRAPNAKLLLGAGAVINPEKLLEEIATHKVAAERLAIDPRAMIIDAADIEFEETRLKERIASTAQGVGAALSRKIIGRGGNLDVPVRLANDISDLKPFIADAQEILEEAFHSKRRILLEGTQGTSLSLHHGPYPHVTSRDTTVAGCLADAGISPTRVRRVVMICRTYPIRVGGTSGPMIGEISYEELSERSGIAIDELKATEKTTTTGTQRRLAEFDWVQFQRSCLLNGPTDIALTFVDYISSRNRSSYRFEQLTEDTLRFIEEVERVSGVPVNLISTNFSWRNVIDRRSW